MDYVIGTVASIDGIKVNILMNEGVNLESFHFNGKSYSGVFINSYVGIKRGSYKLIGRVEKEYLVDTYHDFNDQEFIRNRFERHLEVRIFGYIKNNIFNYGLKLFPMIFNEAVLLDEDEYTQIIYGKSLDEQYAIKLGNSIVNNIDFKLDWSTFFNTHIGIFGNTGSGKSNTLAKIYTELFNLTSEKIKDNFDGKSKFILFDFNGEYMGDQVVSRLKKRINLSTRDDNGDKLFIDNETFWNKETLSVIYSATEKTQKPFLGKLLNYFLDESTHSITTEKIIAVLSSTLKNLLLKPKKDTLDLYKDALEIIGLQSPSSIGIGLVVINCSFLDCEWNSTLKKYYHKNHYINEGDEDIGKQIYESINSALKEKNELIESLKDTDKLKIAFRCQLIYSLIYNSSNFDNVMPLLSRIDDRSNMIERTIKVGKYNKYEKALTVISFKHCNSDAKKILPLLIAKQLYEIHKTSQNGQGITNTVHLIIDEAHNILSEQSTRESESWKDYRLEVFEEMIKEGRKFGFYLTIASQRPYDISPTIISQLHNYFIHRLVNENDLRMIENTVSSLDTISRNRIPTLAPGQCIVSGTSFDMPLLVQIEQLTKEYTPASDSANLKSLWLKDDKE